MTRDAMFFIFGAVVGMILLCGVLLGVRDVPGCRWNQWGNGLADNPCRKTLKWSGDMRDSKACSPNGECDRP